MFFVLGHSCSSLLPLLTPEYRASVATIVRIPYADGILDNPDYLHTSTDIGIWSTVEIGIALTASSLATLKPLLRRMRLFNMSDVMSYGSRSRTQTGGANAPSTKRGSHVKTFSQGNHQVTISTSPPPQNVWTRQKSRRGRGSMEVELVAKGDGSPTSSQDKSSWLDV